MDSRLQNIAQFKNQRNEVKLPMPVFFSQQKAYCICLCLKVHYFSAGGLLLQCQTLSNLFSCLWISHCLPFSFFRWSFCTTKARWSHRCVSTARSCTFWRRVPCMWGEFQGDIYTEIFCSFMVKLYIWPASQFLRRYRIPNSGAALRAGTNDECPVRVN